MHLTHAINNINPILSVKNLSIFRKDPNLSQENIKYLINDLNLEIFNNETFALLGETGSGKSLTAYAIMRLLHPNLEIDQRSSIVIGDQDILALPEVSMRKIRGKDMAIVFQDPSASLNPILTIGKQIEESIEQKNKLSRTQLKLEVISLLDSVELAAEKIYHAYPHELSGGMRQRVLIAMAISLKPKLLIADEPTSALDVTTASQILKLLKDLQSRYQMSMLLITHDLKVASKMADRIGIIQEGRIVEQDKAESILNRPSHIYSQQLLYATPTLHKNNLSTNSEIILEVKDLSVDFPIKRGIFKRTIGHHKVLKDISLTLKEGETLAIVGESGSGKTTLSKTIMSLIKPTHGDVNILGKSLKKLNRQKLREIRSEFQIIFQDPFSSMDPRFTLHEIIEEGMKSFKIGSSQNERLERIDYVLEQVGLSPKYKSRYPHQLSGGQRQRACIARAMVLGPRLIICDEPTSSLDKLVECKIIDLFISLQHEYDISYLFVTHDLSIAKAIAHKIAVIQQGSIVEYGEIDQVFNAPQHSYTRSLLEIANI